METADVRRLINAAEKSANALERIAAALEAANKADPLQLIQEAMALEANQAVNLDQQLPSPDDWRLR